MNNLAINRKLDLVLERVVEVTPELIWKAWTEPALLKQWFCPKPWKTVECDIDLRPGGMFRTVMQSPEGQNMPEGVGCFLEVEKNQKLVWTSALLPGYRPQKPSESFAFTAHILIEPHPKGAKYTAVAMHSDEKGCSEHAKMGFHEGWGIALDQLVALAKTL